MKKNIIKAFAFVILAGGISSCGNDFLDTEYYKGKDSETALNSVSAIATALNGTYYNLYHYKFAGNYAVTIGDIPTDITYWNAKTQHWNDLYTYTYLPTSLYLRDIWEYGYKVIDNATRIIKASEALYEESSPDEQIYLDLYSAEAYALRGYAQLFLVNIFGHQIKVNGTDFSETPGIVVVKEPVKPNQKVTRSAVGQSYTAIVSDLNTSITLFEEIGGDQGSLVYFNLAATYGVLARAYLYMEEWDDAMECAQTALDISGITTLAYTNAAYKALYNNGTSNNESMFALAITPTQHWYAYSSGTVWGTYSYSPSPKLQAMYDENDCRTSVFTWANTSTATVPVFGGGKYSHFESGNSQAGTSYLINASEMFLIIAEANLQSDTGSFSDAQEALLTVAKRNADITTTANLPATEAELLAFLKDERARELFQEGFRLYDLRRWNVLTEVYAHGAPEIKYAYTNYKISDLVFPIPSAEINAGFGVTQNEGWADTRPSN